MRLITALILLLNVVVAGQAIVKAESATVDTLGDVYILCNTQKYADESVFSGELSAVLAALQKEASSASYHASQAGSVMAAYQCRGDIPRDACSQCVGQAAQTALSSCSNAIGSRVQLDGCFLRYENYTFFTEDTGVVVELCNTQKFNSTAVQSQVAQLLNQVTHAAPKNSRLYASATSALPASSATATSTRLYALAQCLDYLSLAQCADCLAAHSASWQDCSNAVGSQIHSVSCYYRYEIYPFFY